jgi:structural maintenance of chromosome 3 (chondroitin sulfate proteoglycan 6)
MQMAMARSRSGGQLSVCDGTQRRATTRNVRSFAALMHIHSIRISGLKSFRDETLIGPFHEGLNVIVGRNGSGKSNLLDAVRLVLGDATAGLTAEQRAALLHEGPGGRALSAFVEVVFDNSDGRFPVDRPRVVLRRMFGLQKDEYLLDRRNVSKAEVIALFESAGFSRSNPYYIVQQGKVAALCTMKDEQRLELLKEIAGTRTFEEKRAESLRILEDSADKRAKIGEILAYIEKRLNELESEKEELLAYQKVDRERRTLERAIYECELAELKTQLENLEHERQHESAQLGKLHQECRQIETELEELEQLIGENERERARLAADQGTMKQEHVKAVEKQSALESELALITQRLENETVELDKAEEKLRELRQMAEQRRQERARILPEFERLRDEEQRLRVEIAIGQQRLLQLQARQHRDVQFQSPAERDSWFREEIARNEQTLTSTLSQLSDVEREISRLEAEASSTAHRRDMTQQQIAAERQRIDALQSHILALKKERNEAHLSRQDLWRRDAELETRRAALLNESAECDRRKRVALGTKFLNAYQMISSLKCPGEIFGPLYTLFEADEKFYVAIEAALGSALNYIVVDTDETAAFLIRKLREMNAGRLTFVPLNRMRSDNAENQAQTSRPVPSMEDAVPLDSRLRLRDERFRPVLDRILGRTLIARSILIASKLAREYDVPCVTLEGDLVNRRGAMHGGYNDRRQSRLAALLRTDRLRAQLREIENDRQNIREQLAERESQIHRAMSELQKTEAQKRVLANTVRNLQEALSRLAQEEESTAVTLEAKRQQMQMLQRHVREYESVLNGLREELAETMASSSPSQSGDGSVDAIASRLAALQQSMESVATERAKYEQRLVEIESELDTYIERQMHELERRLVREAFEDAPELGFAETDSPAASSQPSHIDIEQTSIAALQTRQATLSLELEAAQNAVRMHRESLDRIAVALQRKEAELEEQRRNRDALDTQLPRRKEALATESQRLKVHLARRTQLLQRRTETERKLRELGPAPAQYQELAQEPNHRLMQRLQEINIRFHQLGQVNQKALEQYLSFSSQREELIARQTELERGDASIRTLIETLDRRRANDVQRTFKGIARLFADVFQELVPGGIGQLVMLRTPASTDTAAKPDFTGVAIRVRFPSDRRFCTLAELSGGQKTMVALALILAIQRLDPAPFYLFDEIDASLDAASRERIATLLLERRRPPREPDEPGSSLHRTETPPQLIVTTFRPELVRAANRCYGVTVRDRVSRVEPISAQEALAFVTENERLETSIGPTNPTTALSSGEDSATRSQSISASSRQLANMAPNLLENRSQWPLIAMEQGGSSSAT